MSDQTTLAPDNGRVLAQQRLTQLQADWTAASSLADLGLRKSPMPPAKPMPLPTDYDRTNVIQACRYGDLSALQELLAQNVDIHENDDHALQWAAQNGHTEIVGILLDLGADIHVHDDHCLKIAADQGHTDTVRFLLDRGAKIHAENDISLNWAAFSGHTETARLLLDRGADNHSKLAVTYAFLQGHFETLDLLIDRGASIELSSEQGQSYRLYKQEQQTGFKRSIQAKETLTEIFNIAAWTGHVPEMKALWSQVPEALHSELDFSHVLSDVTIQSMKQRKPKLTLIK
jgi:ankyrin repeat protein